MPPLKEDCASSAAGPSPWLGFASGVVAGATGVLVGHAFDTLKVQAQVGQPSSAGSTPLTFQGVLRLYRGILPPLITTGAIRSLYFGIFENVKTSLSSRGLLDDASMRQTTAASAMTGLATAPVTSPFVTIKCHQQINGGSLREAVSAILHRAGALGFYRGFGLHCSLECVGSTVYLSVYYLAKRALRPLDSPGSESLSLRICAGAISGCVAWSSIYPLDVIRSRLMASAAAATTATACGDSGAPSQRGGLVTMAARECYRSGGMRAFYRGISMTLLRAGPVAGVVLPVNDLLYDVLRQRYSYCSAGREGLSKAQSKAQPNSARVVSS